MKLIYCSIIFLLLLTSFASANFEVNSFLLKVNLAHGEKVAKSFTITANEDDSFSVEVINIPEVAISENSFSLINGESRTINIDFDTSKVDPGVYTGGIKVTSSKDSFYLPVILEVESDQVSYDVNIEIPAQYTQISPGGEFVALVKIFDLSAGGTTEGLGTKSVKLDYHFASTDGTVLSSETETLVIEGRTQLTKTLTFPKSAAAGDYVFEATVTYGDSVGTGTALLNVVDKGFDFFAIDNTLLVVLGILVVCLVAFFIFFIAFLRERKQLTDELRNYHLLEMERQEELLHRGKKSIKHKKRKK